MIMDTKLINGNQMDQCEDVAPFKRHLKHVNHDLHHSFQEFSKNVGKKSRIQTVKNN